MAYKGLGHASTNAAASTRTKYDLALEDVVLEDICGFNWRSRHVAR